MSRSIVCGLDGSRESRAALEIAARLAEQLGLRLVLTHVTEPAHLSSAAVGSMSVRPPAAGLLEVHEQLGERLLEQMAEEAGLADAERGVVVGFPTERLADLAG